MLLVVGLSGFLRWKAVNTLGIDYDEDDYLRAAQQFSTLIKTRDFAGFLETNYRPEHPQLSKILLGLSLLPEKDYPLVQDSPTTAGPNVFLPRPLVKNARMLNAAFGVASTAAISVLNPIGGLLQAVHSFNVKYTSEVMLESVPAFTSFMVVLFYLLWRKEKVSRRRQTTWLILSAVFLGLTAASKYMYAIVGAAVFLDWLLLPRQEKPARGAKWLPALWVLSALLVFFITFPYLWKDPIPRLLDSVFYHVRYSTGAAEVQSANYPVWQPINWLFFSPKIWESDAFIFALDPLITLLALFGLVRLWKKYRVFVLWLMIGIVFLLFWPTKWPQYTILLTAPICLAAAEGLDLLVGTPLRGLFTRWKHRSEETAKPAKYEFRKVLPWLIPGLIFFTLFTLVPLFYQFGVSLTDSNSNSLREAMQGGISRVLAGGISGNQPVSLQEFPYTSNLLHYLGFSNFIPLIQYLEQTGVFSYNLIWTLLSVLLQTTLGVSAALLLWQKRARFRSFWQALFILPWAIPEMIGALMWRNVFLPETGWLALGVAKYGSSFPFAFLADWQNTPEKTLVILLIAGLWYGFPFIMLAASAGLKFIPAEVMDAASIDGAGGWQRLRHVVLPLLAPLVLPAMILRAIFTFNQFYLFQAFYQFSGTLATLSYNFFNTTGYFIHGQFSISAAVNMITLVILLIFVLFFIQLEKDINGGTHAVEN
jgi:ABC-type sugar transport system permease subunit